MFCTTIIDLTLNEWCSNKKGTGVGRESPAIPNNLPSYLFIDELCCADNCNKFIYYWSIDIFNPDKASLVKEVKAPLQGRGQHNNCR